VRCFGGSVEARGEGTSRRAIPRSMTKQKQTLAGYSLIWRAHRNAFRHLVLGLGFACLGLLAAFFFGHLQSRFLFFIIPNLLCVVMVMAAMHEFVGKKRLSVVATATLGTILFFGLWFAGQYISISRVEKLLSARTNIVSGIILESHRCYKGCKWAANFRYQYNGSDFTDEVSTSDRELRTGQRITLLISETNPDVKRIIGYE